MPLARPIYILDKCLHRLKIQWFFDHHHMVAALASIIPIATIIAFLFVSEFTLAKATVLDIPQLPGIVTLQPEVGIAGGLPRPSV